MRREEKRRETDTKEEDRTEQNRKGALVTRSIVRAK